MAFLVGVIVPVVHAQTEPPPLPDHPSITFEGRTYTPRSIVARNIGGEGDATAQFPSHKIIGNIYYVGTKTLSSYLIVTPQGNILLDSTFERNVRTIQKSVTQLGFKFSDTKILLGNHAHDDHQEGDALVKELTGAQVMMCLRSGQSRRAEKYTRSTRCCTTEIRWRSEAQRLWRT